MSVKDEWAELPEWVEHHLQIGVGKMYILDDGSQPPLSSVLAPYIASGAVEYRWFNGVPRPTPPASTTLVKPGVEELGAGAAAPLHRELRTNFTYRNFSHFQLYAYDWCLQHHRHHHTWMGFVDADEYILLRPDIPSLPALLERFEQYGGLAVFSKSFGSSGHLTRPAVGTRLGFTKCQPASKREYYKTIANLHYVLPTFGGRRGPHSFRMRDNATTVNSRGVPVEQDMSKHVVKDEIFLHHYSIRSAEEYAAKARRGGGIHKTGRHDFSQLKWRDSMSTLDCLDAVRHVQRFQASSRYSGDSNPTK
ncbi:hypothetical protein COHA_000515 [Chlorella ohadii]|uniref:Glycosyltransferase family 92 protein n=1 Tax=Chlorella ohadii TaxID=2649997 RepID=A0AAD5E2X3_9CHLO|nr:hypothetical protein COHA_000515 [Chlorella ohadii]